MSELLPCNENTEHTAGRRWVWVSTDESIAKYQISFLAMAEIPCAMSFFWLIGYISPNPWLTLLGFLAAPILLMRSEASNTHGLVLLRRYLIDDLPPLAGQTIAIFLILTIAVVALTTRYFLFIYQCWWCDHLGYLVFMFWMALLYMMAVGSVVMIATALRRDIPSAVWEAVSGKLFRHDGGYKPVADRVASEFALPFITFGFVIRVAFIRFWAAARHPVSGLSQLPMNWRETIALIDLCHLPELLPKASTFSTKLSVKGLHDYKIKHPEAHNIRFLMSLIYIPAMLYRWNLKASAWLWWPLALVLKPPFDGKSEEVTEYLTKVRIKGYWAGKRGYLAFLMAAWLAAPQLSPAIATSLSSITGIGAILSLTASLSPPSVTSLRYLLLWLCVILTIWLHKRAIDFSAAYPQPAKGTQHYEDHVLRIERLRQLLVAVLIITGWVVGFWWAQKLRPDLLQHMVWDWLRPWL